MTKPVRLQLSRRKGFNLQEHSRAVNGLPAVKVTRPGEFGNPYRITGPVKFKDGTGQVEWWVERGGGVWRFAERDAAQARAVEMFRTVATNKMPGAERYRERARLALRGVNLACSCKPGAPCHADVLLEIANGD